jgi:hypothetical protein
MTDKPTKSKAAFVADERAAEAAVIQAEYDARKAELTNDPDAITTARKAVDDARTASLKIRKVMTDGLAQWHAYDSEAELARTARELGLVP